MGSVFNTLGTSFSQANHDFYLISSSLARVHAIKKAGGTEYILQIPSPFQSVLFAFGRVIKRCILPINSEFHTSMFLIPNRTNERKNQSHTSFQIANDTKATAISQTNTSWNSNLGRKRDFIIAKMKVITSNADREREGLLSFPLRFFVCFYTLH